MGKKRVLVGFGVDIDAIAGWLGSYKGEDSTSDISRGYFAGTLGVERVLKMFDKYGIKASWFIPGHSLETFPKQCEMIRDGGHEIGLHGYSHENPTAMSMDQQREILDYTYRLLTKFCNGKPPRGTVAPWWEVSKEATELLLSYGIEYDHSMSHHDCQPYYLRTGDTWTKINYDQPAHTWMHPLKEGQPTGLVEIPANWYLDDLPPMMFMKAVPNSHGWVDQRSIEQLWKDHFDYFYREYVTNAAENAKNNVEGGKGTTDDDVAFIFPLTIHPDTSGRPHGILMLERLIEYINTHEGVEWVTMIEMVEEFRKSNQAEKGAMMPEDPFKVAEKMGLRK